MHPLCNASQTDYSLPEKESVDNLACNIHDIVTDKSMGVWGYNPRGDFLQQQPGKYP